MQFDNGVLLVMSIDLEKYQDQCARDATNLLASNMRDIDGAINHLKRAKRIRAVARAIDAAIHGEYS